MQSLRDPVGSPPSSRTGLRPVGLSALLAAVALLGACGGGGTDSGTIDASLSRGVLIQAPPPRLAPISAAQLQATLQASTSGQGVLQLAGNPVCGVDLYYMNYGTVGGRGEATNATGAIMVPSGSSAQCSGARPIVLWAHGTTTDRGYNMADIQNNGESALAAALFAAQGYIVVAPNYAGYDASRLPYHPYLNADQSSKDMIDALTAARSALRDGRLATTNQGAARVTDGGKLYIFGYSQGGHVAMATHRALQTAGQTVTATAPSAGPYAMLAFGDAVFYGNVNLGSTVFTPLLATSYQKAYGDIYSQTTDLYTAQFATGIETLLPSGTDIAQIFQQGKLPATQLFSSTPPTAPAGSPAQVQATLNAITPPTQPPAFAPLFALGFGSTPLINNNARLAYLLDAFASPDGAVPTLTTGAPAANPSNPLRRAFKTNDLRNWTPTRPTLLCGGNGDPTVFFTNTQLMQGLWTAPSPLAPPAGTVTVLDVDSAPTGANDPFAAAKLGFAQVKAAGIAAGGQSGWIQQYHGAAAPFCAAAARGFFSQF